MSFRWATIASARWRGASASRRAAWAAASAARSVSISSERSLARSSQPELNHESGRKTRKNAGAELIRRAPAEMYGGGSASPVLRPKARRNIPSGESDESLIDEIRVLDPRHPLYGRSFRVIRRSTHRGGNFPPSYEVEYCSGSSLLIPIAVTEWLGSTNDQLKLSIDGLLDLISVIDCLDSHEYEPKRSLDYSAARLRRQIVDDVAAVLAEVFREVRTGQADASVAQGGCLHPAIDAPPGREQSGKSADAVRASPARSRTRMA